MSTVEGSSESLGLSSPQDPVMISMTMSGSDAENEGNDANMNSSVAANSASEDGVDDNDDAAAFFDATSDTKPSASDVASKKRPVKQLKTIPPNGLLTQPGKRQKQGRPGLKQSYPGQDDMGWEIIKNQLRQQLRSMPSDVCFVKALELKQLAHMEVQRQSPHLLSAMNMMSQTTPGPIPEPDVHTPNRNQDPRWMVQFHRLAHYCQTNGHCNVPRLSSAQGSSLYRWAALQRENKSELNEDQISLLNTLGFEWKQVVQQVQLMPVQQVTNLEQTSAVSATGNCVVIPKHVLPPTCDPDPKTDQMPVPEFRLISNYPTGKHFGKCVMCNLSESKIPKQNRGVCNTCDEAVWVVNSSGMKVKWCKGCKNFRKWIAFGAKVSIVIVHRGLQQHVSH